jgi:polyvinyl alcohol dehydrogenase (cytochrome)
MPRLPIPVLLAGLSLLAGGDVQAAATAAAAPAVPHPGEAVYAAKCAQCHEGGVPKSPHKMFLQMMAPDAIFGALESGIMKLQAEALTQQQRREVAEYLAGRPIDTARSASAAPRCAVTTPDFAAARAAAPLAPDQLPRLKLKWAFAFPDAQRVRSRPTVAGDTLFIGSQDGTVYALDRDSGCVRWTHRASAEVRTPVIVAGADPAGAAPARPLAYFADLLARVYAVDARTGELAWSVKVDDHPNATVTGAPTLSDGRLYVPVSSLEVTSAADPKYPCCSFRGAVLAIDAASGAVLWKSHTIDEVPREVGRTSVGTPILAPSGAPVWNSPTVDAERGLLYVGTGENYSSPANDRSDALLAFELATGKLAWHRQMTTGDAWNVACMMQGNPNCPHEDGPDVDFGAGTLIVNDRQGRHLLLAGQKSGDVYALDLDARGAPVWRTKVGRGGIQGGVHFGMAAQGQAVFVPISDMRNEYVEGQVYEEEARPGLYALDVNDGRLLWAQPADDVCQGREFCEPGISAAIYAVPGAVFAGHMDGRVRATDAANGRVLWEYDTTREVTAVDGARARGGSIGGGAGPVAAQGMLFVASGYGIYFHMPGNLLLAFAPE